MTIDLILNRHDGFGYDPDTFYRDVSYYGQNGIALAMDYGDNYDVQREIISYLLSCKYNLVIAGYVESVNWLEPDSGGREYPDIGSVWNDEQYGVLADFYRKKYDL